MGIKYDRQKKHYVVTYHRRHPVTKQSRGLRRQGIKSKQEAEKVYKTLIIKMGEKFNENLHPLWPELVEKFLDYYANCGIAKNTLKNYAQCLKANTFQVWGNKRINEFSTSEIRDFILDDCAKFSEAHRKSMLKYLRAVFRYAVEHDLINRDPCPRLKFKKNEKIKKMLKEEEIKILLREAKAIEHEWFPVWAVATDGNYTTPESSQSLSLSLPSVDGDIIPADPGDSGNATLLGVDSDKDGVRDDIELWVNNREVTNLQNKALKQIAKSLGKQVEFSEDEALAIEAIHNEVNSVYCLKASFGKVLAKEALADLKITFFNTDERLLAWARSQGHFGGEIVSIDTNEVDYEKYCN